MHRVTAAVLAIMLVGCGAGSDPTPTPVPLPSLPADDQEAAQDVVDAFLATMADPDVTYRATGELRVGEEDENGRPDILIYTSYDVKGDGYGGRVGIHLRDPTVGGNFQLVVNDGTAQLWGLALTETLTFDAPDELRRPDAIQDLTADDLSLVGVTDEGIFEFLVAPWLGGDPLGELVDLETVPSESLPHTEVRWHDTRLFLDDAGTPLRLAHTWSYLTEEGDEEFEGTIVEEFEALGMYVNLDSPPDGLLTTSHDTDAGPFREIVPAEGPTATIEVRFAPGGPGMLGIEGAIYFVRSHDADGEVVADRIVLEESATVEIGAGDQTLVAYYRTCNGNCSLLDGPHDFCEVDADIQEGTRYVLTIDVDGPGQAGTCTLVARDADA